MKITGAYIFVELDNSNELRQVFIDKKNQEYLIAMISANMFHPKGTVTISEEVLDSLKVKKYVEA